MAGHKMRAGEFNLEKKFSIYGKLCWMEQREEEPPAPNILLMNLLSFVTLTKIKMRWLSSDISSLIAQTLLMRWIWDKEHIKAVIWEVAGRSHCQVRLEMCIHSSRCHCSLSCSWRQGTVNSSRTASLIFTCIWGTQATFSPFHPHSKADSQQMKCYITLFCEELLRITLLST